MALQPLDASVKSHLDSYLHAIEEAVSADVVAFVGPIVPGLDHRMRDAIEAVGERKKSVSVILDTPGGIVEVVERMVATLRWNYQDVTVIVPDRAMSAGTIFALTARGESRRSGHFGIDMTTFLFYTGGHGDGDDT